MNAETPRRVPVVLYVATSDADAAELLTTYCRQYAAARDWDAAETLTDLDRQAPLASRPGWSRVLALLSDQSVRGIITYSAPMIAAPEGEFEKIRDLLKDQGAFLAVARSQSGTPDVPTHRTPGQMARRQDIVDAASGYDGRGAGWGLAQ
ncbi:hypothetical protein AB4Z54_13805 [Streptomyces sp. MCAF7]